MNAKPEPAEIRFAERYVRKSRQERLCFELGSPKHRYRGLSRFSHQAEELLAPERIVGKGTINELAPALDELAANSRETSCSLFSPDPALDQTVMTLQEALTQAAQSLDAVIIAGDSFAVVFTEPEKGGRDVFLLR